MKVEVLYGYQVVRPEYLVDQVLSTSQQWIAIARPCEYSATPHKSACCRSCGGPAPEEEIKHTTPGLHPLGCKCFGCLGWPGIF